MLSVIFPVFLLPIFTAFFLSPSDTTHTTAIAPPPTEIQSPIMPVGMANAQRDVIKSIKKVEKTLVKQKQQPKPTAKPKKIAPIKTAKTTQVQTPPQLQHIQRQTNLNPNVLKLALTAYNKVDKKGLVNKPYLTVIDYSLPSSKKRMWVIDVKKAAVMFHTYVAHGKNSGDLHSTNFSNKGGSKASSLGTFLTSNTYHGSVGYALNLKGLEKGINDNALSRRIVMHGANYVSPAFLSRHGRLGRSWGCPALEQHLAPKVINHIKGGSVVFAYYPQKQWLGKSNLLAV